MKKPDTRTMVMGHPVVTVPVMLLGGVTLLAAFHAGNVLMVFFGAAIIVTVQKANEQARAYKAWEREWNAMAPATPREGKRNRGQIAVLLSIGALFALLRMGGASTPHTAMGSGLIAGGIWIIPAMLLLAIRWSRRRRSMRTRSFVVAVVARPVMPVPDLADAYRALPAYCHALLRGQA